MTTNREAPQSESLMGELREDGTLVFERIRPGPIERVWAYLIDGDKRALWLAGGDMPVVPGATGRMTFNHAGLTDPRRPFWTAFTAAETHYAVRMGSAGD